ncbi:response regulator, partial [Klebsiella pneumoniae]|nr:response regulator [Klebsiella pneumoniae]
MAKLLVVDDERNLRMVIQKELSRQNHHVETAEDGEEAWARLESEDFDVLLCDINMPRLDGIELLR